MTFQMNFLNGRVERQNLHVLLTSLAPLVGPRFGFGQCLAPEYPSGTLFWIDPERTPQDGDLVWYRWSEAWCAHLRQTYGVSFTGGAKYYRVKDDITYLESNEGMVPLTSEWIIEGVVAATFTFRHPPAQLAEVIARADAEIAEVERKMDATNAPSPLDAKGAVKRDGARA